MKHSVETVFGQLAAVKEFLMTLLLSMVPVIELRGGIPYGLAQGLTWWEAYGAAVIGNMLPVPVIMLGVRWVFGWLRKISPRLEQLVERLEKKAEKSSKLVHEYSLVGLCILVAIPLPGTGAWTGALVAAMLDLRMKHAVPVILLGVLIAGGIVTAISLGTIAVVGG